MEARSSIFEYIEGFYNGRRRHSFLNYLSPFELLYFRLVAYLVFTFWGADHFDAVNVNSKIYIIGGFDGSKILKSAEVYIP